MPQVVYWWVTTPLVGHDPIGGSRPHWWVTTPRVGHDSKGG